MSEKREGVTKADMNNPDLGLDVLMTKTFKQLKKEILKDKKLMSKIAIDERHVRVITFRILCENVNAIEKFNRISILLTLAILGMMVIQIIFSSLQLIRQFQTDCMNG